MTAGKVLSDWDKDFLRLVLRSPDVGGGWRNVSRAAWPLVERFPHKDLIETEANGSGGGRVRLTDRGIVVIDYM